MKSQLPNEETITEDNGIVPRQVQYENRKVTDRIWFPIYVLSYIGFLASGFTIVSQAAERYEYDEDGFRTIGSQHLEKAQQCCATYQNNTLYSNDIPYGFICEHLGSNRRLQDENTSKFDVEDGIFDAFLMAPEIMIVMFLTVIAFSAIWILLLRFFAKPVILFIEVCKVLALIYFGYVFESWILYVIACASVAYAVWARNKLDYAAKIISYSTTAMKENPSIWIGAFVTKLIFAGNAALFVIFFSESFEVVEIKGYTVEHEYSQTTSSWCEFQSPKYVYDLMMYNCFAYLWTIIFLDSVRLSIVSSIVGSWHFHPEDKPSTLTVFKNVIPSVGTISISSLVSAIAERVKKWILGDIFSSCGPMCFLTSPLRVLACFCTVFLNSLVNTCTRFALIIHVFAGKTYFQSGKSAFKILSRNFKDGVVTEVSSKSVLYVASYAFSISIVFLSWIWIADRFDCENLSDLDTATWILYIFLSFFVVYYPVIGLYLIILLDQILRSFSKPSSDTDFVSATNSIWIPPLAATFVGCIAMMIFSFISALFLDISDTLFLCFSIDKDHNVTDMDDELKTLIEQVPGYLNAEYVLDDPEEGKKPTIS